MTDSLPTLGGRCQPCMKEMYRIGNSKVRTLKNKEHEVIREMEH